MTLPKLGPQEPPDDPRIFNRRQPDGTFRPMSEFFEPNKQEHTMTAQHTLGPWKILKYGDGSIFIGPDDGHGKIATIHMRPSKTNNIEEERANAHLIAAAPELLAALKECYQLMTDCPSCLANTSLDFVEGIIAKATQ